MKRNELPKELAEELERMIDRIVATYVANIKKCSVCGRLFRAKRPWAIVCSNETCKLKAKREYQNSDEYKSRRNTNRVTNREN